MNIHRITICSFSTRFMVWHSLALLGVIVSMSGAPVWAEDSAWLEGQPTLQRVLLLESKGYAIDYSYSNGIGRALLELDHKAGDSANPIRYYLFGKGVGLVQPPKEGEPDPKLPERWTLAGQTLIVTWDFESPIPGTQAPRALDYPLEAFFVDPSGIRRLDGVRLRKSLGATMRLRALGPMAYYRQGMTVSDEGESFRDGHVRLCAVPEQLFYDIRPMDVDGIDLYLAVDEKLEKWVLADDRWRLVRRFELKVTGPFLLCHDATCILAEEEGHWCLIDVTNDSEQTPNRITKRIPNEPIVLVEDIVGQSKYFEHDGRLLNENGVEIWSIPEGQDAPDKLKAISEFVRSLRAK